MASTIDFVDYVTQQLAGIDGITCCKMFGEYGLHYNGKFFACICDNRLFVKITQAGKDMLPGCPTAPPVEGSKPYFLIEDLDDGEFLKQLVQITYAQLPEPKPKKKKRNAQNSPVDTCIRTVV